MGCVHAGEAATQAGGTRPTGMHSCSQTVAPPTPFPLTLIIGILTVRATQPLTVTHNVCENPTESSHVGQRQVVRSVVRDGEDSSDVIVSVTSVTSDDIEDDPLSGINRYLIGKLDIEYHF